MSKSEFESLRKEGRFSDPISFAAELHIISTLRLERLYESCNVLLCWGRSPFQGWAPGRAAKNRLARRWRCFSGNFGHVSASCPDLCVLVIFPKTHRQTQRIYSWIAPYLRMVAKLIRSETNSQILRNLHFCEPFTPIFDKHVETRFPLPLYYS